MAVGHPLCSGKRLIRCLRDGSQAARSPAASTNHLPHLPGPALRLPLHIPVGPGLRQPCARMRHPRQPLGRCPGPGRCTGPCRLAPQEPPSAAVTGPRVGPGLLCCPPSLCHPESPLDPLGPWRACSGGRGGTAPEAEGRDGWKVLGSPTHLTPRPHRRLPNVYEPVTPRAQGPCRLYPTARSTVDPDATWTNMPRLPEISALCPCRTSPSFPGDPPAGLCP